MNFVTDKNRAVHQHTNPRLSFEECSHAREPGKQIDMIEQRLTKTGGYPAVFSAIYSTNPDRSLSALCAKRRR